MLYRKLNEIFLLILVLISMSLFLWLIDGDRFIARLAYVDCPDWNGANPLDFWSGSENIVFDCIYYLASYPVRLYAVCALIVFLISLKIVALRKYRRQALFITLFILLGPMLIVNVLLKDNLGRPRPYEITEFHGKHEFTQFWDPGTAGVNSSFPSGHAAVAFSSIAPWFIFRRYRGRDYTWMLLSGASWGGVVGFTRMLQGGHFLSDVLWAGGIIFITGQVLSIWLKPELNRAE